MPSTTSSSVSRPLASSTVMTPSLPTFCMALAIMSPISRSPLAAMEPTWAISSEVEIFFERFLTSSTTASTARSMPRFRSIGFMPAATARTPSRTIALASVTPSLVMRGAPNDLSSTTLRPFGPSVTRTAFARISTPRSMRSRASVENLTSLAAIGIFSGTWSGDHAHDVGLFHDQQFVAVELHLGAGPLAEQNLVAGLDVDRDELAVFIATAGADSDNFALHWLFLGGVGNDDPAGGLVLGFNTLD